MNTENYISELFFSYDCIIIPEFGGFVASYAPASIHPTQHTFTPPHKKIVFNKSLVNNDGLLAHHIAVSENISFSQAMEKINLLVIELNSKLKNGSKAELKDIGTLFPDVEKNICFEPSNTINYLTEGFGLSPFQSPAVKRGSYPEGLSKTFKDREALPLKSARVNIKKYVAFALTAPLIFAMIWVPLKTDLLHNVNYNSLNPFQKSIALYTPRTIMPEVIRKEDLSSSVIVKSDTPSEKIEALAQVNHFHIVGGCFELLSNAENFVSSMNAKNTSASIIGKNKNGLHIVSLGEFSSRKEAYLQLENIRKTNPDAWMLKD